MGAALPCSLKALTDVFFFQSNVVLWLLHICIRSPSLSNLNMDCMIFCLELHRLCRKVCEESSQTAHLRVKMSVNKPYCAV